MHLRAKQETPQPWLKLCCEYPRNRAPALPDDHFLAALLRPQDCLTECPRGKEEKCDVYEKPAHCGPFQSRDRLLRASKRSSERRACSGNMAMSHTCKALRSLQSCFCHHDPISSSEQSCGDQSSASHVLGSVRRQLRGRQGK